MTYLRRKALKFSYTVEPFSLNLTDILMLPQVLRSLLSDILRINMQLEERIIPFCLKNMRDSFYSTPSSFRKSNDNHTPILCTTSRH